MNFIERIAPGWSANRQANKLRLDFVKRQRASLDAVRQNYYAARKGGRFAKWSRPHSSANTELQNALPLLRASARALVRNNPYANRGLKSLAAHIAGTGLRPHANINSKNQKLDKHISEKAHQIWDQFTEKCDPAGRADYYGFQRTIARTIIESGEVLVLWTPRQINNKLEWRCSILEGDYIDQNKTSATTDGGYIIQGVEFNKWGERVAYWLFPNHPGEYFAHSTKFVSKRVAAEFVDHAFEVMRPGQVRGVPWFAPVATIIYDLNDFAEAELVRKKLEACISMVVTNANDDADLGVSPIIGGVGGENEQGSLTDSAGRQVESFSPGMIVSAKPGWDITFNAPPSSDGLVEHMQERLHAVAAGLGTTYAMLTADVSKANFSSMREGRLEFERLLDAWQDDLLIVQTGRPAWRRVMQAAKLNGDLKIEYETLPVEWIRPKRPWVDPLKDVKSAIAEIDAGLASPQEIISRRGRDPDVVRKENIEWAKNILKSRKETNHASTD